MYYQSTFIFQRKNIFGKWKNRTTNWIIQGYVWDKYTSLNSRDIIEKKFLYQSVSNNSMAQVIGLWESGDIRNYIHTKKPIKDFYEIKTKKGTCYGNLNNWIRTLNSLK